MGKRIRFHCQANERGFSMLEVMMAGALLGFLALALLPAMLSLSDSLKMHSFRAQCTAIVRAKIQEYVNGVGARSTLGNTPTASGYIPSGFEYTKQRYYDNSSTYCQATPSGSAPGFRERVSTNKIVAANAAADDDPLTPDLPQRMLGFQLFVNIRHYNPRVNQADGGPRRQCPTGGTHQTPYDYQFFRLGDALEVTVTGMIRVRPTIAQGGRGGAKWGAFDDADASTPNPRLICSATQLVYPPRLPFRYYLGADGKIRNYQATLAFVAGSPASSLEAMEAHFRHLWSQVPGPPPAANPIGRIDSGVFPNIRSFTVSPENNSVYILKPGELKLYSNCSDQNVTMQTLPPSSTNVTIEKVPDCLLDPTGVTTWSVPGNIENIAVDFQDLTNFTDDKVYGLFNTGANGTGEVSILDLTSGTAVPTKSNFIIPATKPRIRGLFITPTFPFLLANSATTMPNLFYFDNTCSGGVGTPEEGHCVSVFNSADSLMSRPVRELPVQVESISN